MDIICLDLEGVLIPEIWIAFADKTGIEGLRLTTRDIADYDELMQHRLKILDENGLKLADIQAVIDEMAPLPGAEDFVETLRSEFQLVILSDTFYEFAQPFMRKLAWPTLLCHRLNIADDGAIAGYQLRQPDGKRCAVNAFKSLNYRIFAAGDSYNDTRMLEAADAGFLFHAPDNVIAEFPQFRHITGYEALLAAFRESAAR